MTITPYETHISVPRTARYYTLGQPTDKVKQVWFIFHGYGQLASQFIEGFNELSNPETFLIAPEGLSRFYVSGGAGKVGASWMTSENRENEITDQLGYLDAIYGKVTSLPYIDQCKIVVLGFSQGVATACRWINQLKINVDRVILWAGGIPPEVDLWQINNQYPATDIYLVSGTGDPFVKAEEVNEQEQRLQKADMNYRKIRFDGKHVLDPVILKKIAGYPFMTAP